MSHRRVVVTGLGWATPLGNEVEPAWQAMLAGKSGVKLITRFSTEGFSVKFGGEISNWTGAPHLDTRDLKRMDRFAQYAMHSSINAVQDSGVDFSKEDLDRCGVIIGSGIGGIDTFGEGFTKMLEKGPTRISPMMIPKLMINAASANVSMHYGLTGVNSAAVTACASAGHSAADAFRAIQRDEADIMIAGGSEAAVSQFGLACFMNMKALSLRNDAPEKASRPFDRDRDGFILSEGAGVVILEEYEHARKRGARIYGEMLGAGMTADGSHITQPHEDGRGAREAMVRALKSAALGLDRIDYINAHGTSTPLGDAAENRAVKSLFGPHAYKLAMSSTKSCTGHLLGASGGVELVIVLKAIQNNVMPPTINLDNPDEGFDLNYVPNVPQDRKINYALSNSFGFGGHNVSLLIGRV